jgi:hypothetical protein
LAALLAAAATAAARRTAAAEDPVNFVHGLQEKGYADQAAAYLAERKASGDLPPELAAVYDLEMARCLRGVATKVQDAAARQEKLAAAKEHLARFLQQHADHPRAGEAMVLSAGFFFDAAVQHWQAAHDARSAEDAVEKAAEMTAVREALNAARTRLTEATEKFHQQLLAVRGNTKQNKMLRADIVAAWENASFRAILCDYYAAQTYEDPKDPRGREMLAKAAREFDDFFQARRTTDLGLYAHTWQAKAVIELGDLELAADILDEVLARYEAEDAIALKYLFAQRQMARHYAQAKRLRLEVTARQSVKEFIAEARKWRDAWRRELAETEGYQALSLALARALMARAENAEAVKVLDEVVRIPGVHQAEALQLRRELEGAGEHPPDEAAAAGQPKDRGAAEALWEPPLGEFSTAAWEAAAEILDKMGAEALKAYQSSFSCRGRSDHARVLAGNGGTMQSERAVARALHWLMRHQAYDGSWSFDKYKTQCKDASCTGAGAAHADTGATGLALLCYLGAGQTHKTKGPYRRNIEQGLIWLVRHQERDGNLAKDCVSPMYSHGIAAMALCEAFGLSGDRNVGQAAQGAVNYIVAAQNKNDHGWRYNPGDPGDTCVTAWQIMALKSAAMAGLNVGGAGADSVFDLAGKWLDLVQTGPHGGQFQYQPGTGPTPTMSAAGLLCRQYLHVQRSDPLMLDGVRYLLNNPPEAKIHNVYYWYYATQVLHNYGGRQWDTWNRAMRKLLAGTQVGSDNCAYGSWDPGEPCKDQWGPQGGRLMTTALSCLTLEIYYRYLPLYKIEAEERTK